MKTSTTPTFLNEEKLVQNVTMQGLQYVAENFKLLNIITEGNQIRMLFEFGLTIVSKGGGCSGEDILTTELLNSEGQTLAIW